METRFSIETNNVITEANINFYSTPFVHPKRKMKEHDFIYLIDGIWKFGQNEEVFEMHKDDILILSAEQTHFGITPCKANTKTMYFHVSCPCIDEKEQNQIVLQSLCNVSLNKNIKKIFSEIVNAKLLQNQNKANVYFKLLLLELQENKSNSTLNDVSSQIKTIIHNHPESFFSNQSLAKAVNVSTKTAENKFKAKYGISIHKYILEFKIHEAISYFKIYPDMSIKEVAINLGFYDEYHFSNQFKKAIGISPKKYKNQLH